MSKGHNGPGTNLILNAGLSDNLEWCFLHESILHDQMNTMELKQIWVYANIHVECDQT